MNEIDRYLKRATRGLWGQKKRDAQAELRGAIEDKMYRCRLLGLDETRSVASTLSDLGSPAAIARELGEVHTVPQTLKVLVFVGVAGLLGLQAVAQVGTVRAAPDVPPSGAADTCNYSEARINTLSKDYAQYVRQNIERLGSRALAEADCRTFQYNPNRYLRLDDLITALRTGGIKVQTYPNADGLLDLTFPDPAGVQVLNLSSETKLLNGQTYVSKFSFLSSVRRSLKVPLQLRGVENPVLTIGNVKIQLGTAATPLLASDLYAPLVADDLTRLLQLAAGSSQSVRLAMLEDLKLGSQLLQVKDQDGAFYVTVSNENFLAEEKTCNCDADAKSHRFYTAGVTSVQDGGFGGPPSTVAGLPRLVSTPVELFKATEQKQPAFLVYKLDTSDLRQLHYTPVPAAQLRARTAPSQETK